MRTRCPPRLGTAPGTRRQGPALSGEGRSIVLRCAELQSPIRDPNALLPAQNAPGSASSWHIWEKEKPRSCGPSGGLGSPAPPATPAPSPRAAPGAQGPHRSKGHFPPLPPSRGRFSALQTKPKVLSELSVNLKLLVAANTAAAWPQDTSSEAMSAVPSQSRAAGPVPQSARVHA